MSPETDYPLIGYTILGVLAALLVLTAYYWLEIGKLKPDDPKYYAMNGLSSLCLIASIIYNFDTADAGATLMEVCWLAISLKGLWRTFKAKKTHL